MTALTVKQTAEQLRVSKATICGLCARKRLTHLRVGAGRGTIRFRPEDLAA
jgi:excisionase family DNA binding protein